MQQNTNVQSSYWKVNNTDYNYNFRDELGAVFPTNTAMSMETDTLAVSSNGVTENLRIYQLANNSLIHLASVTFPDIHVLKFLKPVSQPPYDFKFLLSGHSNGIMHLSAIPLTEGSVFENAEIIKRFNHKKALEAMRDSRIFNRNPYILNNGMPSTTITAIDLSSTSWSSSPLNSSVVVYDHHLFYWDTTRSTKPISILKKPGICNAAANKHIDSLTAVVGDFGLSMLDLRTRSSTLKFNGVDCTSAHWCNSNENLLATVTRDPNTIQLWDIRNSNPITTLTKFSGKINDVKWNQETLWVAQSSGKLSKWDVSEIESAAAYDFQISNSDVMSLELNDESSTIDEVVCIDSINISKHKAYKERNLSINNGSRLLELPAFHKLPNISKSTSAVCDTPTSESFNIFDTKPTDRRCSDETLAASTRTGDYLIDFQKEVTEMIQQMDTRTINNIVYL